jgi:hypothetical protein
MGPKGGKKTTARMRNEKPAQLSNILPTSMSKPIIAPASVGLMQINASAPD